MADTLRNEAESLTMRILHLLVIGALVFAAAYVYRIKMASTIRTERVLRLHAQIREQRDAIAVLRAEWTKLDAPSRLQGLAERHLPLKPVTAAQYDSSEEPAGTAAELCPAGRAGSDRRDDRRDRFGGGRSPCFVTGSVPAPERIQ